ncbi:cyclase, partial [Campylobacter coli]|nr:cyclase [Campylobacter coli]
MEKQHLVNIEQWYCLSYTFNSRRKFYKDNKGFLNNQERYSGRLINRET